MVRVKSTIMVFLVLELPSSESNNNMSLRLG